MRSPWNAHELLLPSGKKEVTHKLTNTINQIERITPWVKTLASHAEQLKDERNQELTADELESRREARTRALEELVTSHTGNKQRHGQWVASLGASVGFRIGSSSPHPLAKGGPPPLQPTETLRGDTFGIIDTPLTLPIGLVIQRLPENRRRSIRQQVAHLFHHGRPGKGPIGVGAHFALSAVDVGQYVIAGRAIEGVTWNEFLSVNTQVGLALGTPRDTFVLATDYRYAPTVGTRGAHQFGMVFTYYVPFLNFN